MCVSVCDGECVGEWESGRVGVMVMVSLCRRVGVMMMVSETVCGRVGVCVRESV